MIDKKIEIVSRTVTKVDFDKNYSWDDCYYPIKQERGKVRMIYLATSKEPNRIYEPVTDEDLLAFDHYRRARNIRPFITEEVSIPLKLTGFPEI